MTAAPGTASVRGSIGEGLNNSFVSLISLLIIMFGLLFYYRHHATRHTLTTFVYSQQRVTSTAAEKRGAEEPAQQDQLKKIQQRLHDLKPLIDALVAKNITVVRMIDASFVEFSLSSILHMSIRTQTQATVREQTYISSQS